MEEVDWSSLHKILSDVTRRSILDLLAEKETLSYTEILALLRVTNTGRLNYHLKALGSLVSKDDQGRYHLTERGQLAANLLRTFPERVPSEKKQRSLLRIAVATILILVGILLIFSALLVVVSLPSATVSSFQVSVSDRIIPPNTTVSLTSWNVVPNASSLNIAWSASTPVFIYVVNTTQYDALLLQHTISGQVPETLENFSGMPASYVSQYDFQTGSISLSLQQDRYYFFAGSNTQAILDLFSLTQQQHQAADGSPQSPLEYLPALVLVVLGTLMIVLAFLILTRRV
jgi:DNA-binding transcriptional ArsR family regulator